MRPEYAFAQKTRVVKVKGHRVGRVGLVVKVDFLAGMWDVLWDDTKLVERANPYEFNLAPKNNSEN